MQFIPDSISPAFIKIFRTYTWYLFKRRFSRVLLKNDYKPSPDRSTLFYFNHNSWWDGLIPFLLNEYIFHQKGHAVMELHQMKDIRFFKWIGAYSIDRSNPRGSIQTLQYTVDKLQVPGNSVFLYPQGKIVPQHTPIQLESGISWLAERLPPHADIVPGAIFMHTQNSDKPELLLNMGSPVSFDITQNRKQQTRYFADILQEMFHQTVASSVKLEKDFTVLMD